MAEKTAEHKKLIEEARGLDITSAHLFGLDKLKQRIEEVKSEKGGDKENTEHKGASTEEKGTTPTDESLNNLKDHNPTPTPEKKDEPPSGEATAKATRKKGDSFLYHKTEKPRLFMDGEDVPEGWNLKNQKCWKVLDNGKYINVNG